MHQYFPDPTVRVSALATRRLMLAPLLGRGRLPRESVERTDASVEPGNSATSSLSPHAEDPPAPPRLLINIPAGHSNPAVPPPTVSEPAPLQQTQPPSTVRAPREMRALRQSFDNPGQRTALPDLSTPMRSTRSRQSHAYRASDMNALSLYTASAFAAHPNVSTPLIYRSAVSSPRATE